MKFNRAQYRALQSMMTSGWTEPSRLGFSAKTRVALMEQNLIEAKSTDGRKNSLRYRITAEGLEKVK